MELLLVLPLPVRLTCVFLAAAGLATFLNAAIYSWAWQVRLRSPWQPLAEGAAPRGWLDCLPILGWWRMRRESSLHGTGHWVRPMLVELAYAAGMAWLYWWEVEAHGLVTEQLAYQVPRDAGLVDFQPLTLVLHLQFLLHAMLIALMVIATFIDIDDYIIPDMVTVPGTILGLIFVTLFPLALLPQVTLPDVAPQVGLPLQTAAEAPVLGWNGIPAYYQPVHLAASSSWPEQLQGAPQGTSLAVGLGCFWLWCFAFVRRRWLPRRGLARAAKFFLARIGRDWWSTPLREITAVGTVAVVAVWFWGGPAWVGLLSGLVGAIGSGGTVWLIRIFASAALRREAMGFGDVLLMMMIGAFIGWQAGVIVFFVAPFAALVLGSVQLLLRRGDVLPYGPFLCAATLLVVVRWDTIWLQLGEMFRLAWLVPSVLLVCLVLCGALLTAWQGVKDLVARRWASQA